MRFYPHTHGFYCGSNVHARTMHLCIRDQAGNVVGDRNIAGRPDTFRPVIGPFRDAERGRSAVRSPTSALSCRSG
jgi:hypothetical protein